MGRYLYAYFTENLGVELDKVSFVSWNMLPDVAPSLFRLSHFKKDIYDLVMARAEHLSKEGERMSVKEYSRQLGILCHFMSDFFCYAHAEYFSGSKVGHLRYELLMQLYGYRRKEMLHAVDLIANAAELDHSAAPYEQINQLPDQYPPKAPSSGGGLVFSLSPPVGLPIGVFDQPTPSAP